MKVGVVGLGLMGGSLALAMREKGLAETIFGTDQNENHAKYALETKMIDALLSLDEVSEKADLVILATDMDAIQNQLPYLLNKIEENVIVTDLGSTKSTLAKLVSNHPKRKNYVAAHPIAGTEFSGPLNAKADLYSDKMMILCDLPLSSKDASHKVSQFFSDLRMNIVEMDAQEHDSNIAYVSHLSHIISFALGATVLEKEKMHDNILAMAGSGFASTVRLAKSSSKMWVPIIKQNKKPILSSVSDFLMELESIKKMIEKEEWETLKSYLNNSNKIKKILN